MPGGRPPMIESPNEMLPLIENYFIQCDEKGDPYTIPGLAYAIGFKSRMSLWEYEEKEEFADTIKRAKLKIEDQRSKMLIYPGKANIAGIIFDLKNNFGYVDKQEIDVKHGINPETMALAGVIFHEMLQQGNFSLPMPQDKDVIEGELVEIGETKED